MEKKIKYPIFLFEKVHDDNRLGAQMEGMYSSIEGLNVGLESWMINENLFKAYDAEGRLLNLSTEWIKITENGLFGKCIVNREFIKVNLSDKPIARADALKKFLQFNLSETINHIKDAIGNGNLKQFKIKIETGLLWKTQRVVKNEFIDLLFIDGDVIHMKPEFLKRLMLDFVNNLLKNDLINKMELIDLAKLAGQLWAYDDRGNGIRIENQF